MGCDITGCENLIWDWKFPEQNETKKKLLQSLSSTLFILSKTGLSFLLVQDCPNRCQFYLIFYSVKNVSVSSQIK